MLANCFEVNGILLFAYFDVKAGRELPTGTHGIVFLRGFANFRWSGW
jgi:hypothetical protein